VAYRVTDAGDRGSKSRIAAWFVGSGTLAGPTYLLSGRIMALSPV
jgi:hypothetical protein